MSSMDEEGLRQRNIRAALGERRGIYAYYSRKGELASKRAKA